MLQPAARAVARRNVFSTALRPAPHAALRPHSRTLFTSPAAKKSSFKSAFVRWAAVGGLVYYYSTSGVFADEPKYIEAQPSPSAAEDERPPSLIDEVRKSTRQGAKRSDGKVDNASRQGSPEEKRVAQPTSADSTNVGGSFNPGGGPEALEEEAGQEEAFNPETGEINWDCPCLGGMAHGPCGEEFKAAFSCFVYSTEDPKGVDCIEKFKGMQTCFQQHPDIYGAELEDGEEGSNEPLENLEVFDPQNPKETPSPGTSSTASSITHVDPAQAKPSTEPVDPHRPEDKLAAHNERLVPEQTTKE